MSTTAQTATDIRPFHVDVPDEELAELRRRIAATRWPSSGAGRRSFAGRAARRRCRRSRATGRASTTGARPRRS